MIVKSEEISKIFSEVYPNLCRFLESIVGRDNQAQDIAQESFLRLCQTDFGEISAVEIRYWLFRVARNLALNEISRNKTQSKFWDRIAAIFYRAETAPIEQVIENENAKIVEELLRILPEHQRSALLLREREEMSYRQIALVLEISENKVKVDIFRARQSLRLLWNERAEKQRGKL